MSIIFYDMYSPEGGQDRGVNRPRDQDIDAVVDNQMTTRKMHPPGYDLAKKDIMRWANGEQGAAREEYYRGWLDEDFVLLLKKLKEREGAVGPNPEVDRPSDEDIDDAVENALMGRPPGKIGFMAWASGARDRVSDKYYRGWTDEDFARVLKELEDREGKK